MVCPLFTNTPLIYTFVKCFALGLYFLPFLFFLKHTMQLSMHGCLNCTEHLSLDIALLNSSLTAIDCLHELGLAIVTHKWWFLWRWKWVLVTRLRLTRLTLAFVIEVVAEPRYSFPLKYWNTNEKKIQLEVYHVKRTLKFLWKKNFFQNMFTLGLQSFFPSKCCL